MSSDEKIAMKSCNSTVVSFALKPASAEPAEVKVYQKRSGWYTALADPVASAVDSVTAYAFNTSSSKVIFDDANGTSTDITTARSFSDVGVTSYNATALKHLEYPHYAIRVLDDFGNYISSQQYGTVKGIVSAAGANSTYTYNSAGPTGSKAANVVYSRGTDSDTITITTNSGLSTTVPVTVNWGSVPSVVNIYTASDYLLNGAIVPMLVKTMDSDGNVRSTSDNMTLVLDNISAVRVYKDAALTNEIESGDADVDTNPDGWAKMFVKVYGPAGDINITIRDASGELSTTRTFHIVDSVSDIPVVIGDVTLSPTGLDLVTGASSTVTVTVKDSTANPVGSYEVSIVSDNTNIASVDTSTVTTDANGQATFTVTAGSTEGTAHISATAGSVSDAIDVVVTAASEECGPDNLGLCQTEDDCVAAGGNWCSDTGVCQADDCGGEEPVDPPAETNVGMCDADCQATAPVQVGDDGVSISFNYTRQVNILVGIMTADFMQMQWLTAGADGCQFSADFVTIANVTEVSCSGAAVPPGYEDGWLFWMVTEEALADLDWVNGAYDLLFYQIGQ
jgi:hypothetical protein